MILSEKIAEERKKNGWSQEELAEKLDVSRQAVSKWESAQSTPDLQKLLRMAAVFGVSTDYLLKDEMDREVSGEIPAYTPEEIAVRPVSMEEANEFLDWRRKSASSLAGAVALCIVSPALLIFLSGLSDAGRIHENMVAAVGVPVLLVMVALAVVIFIFYGIHGKTYEYLEKEPIETAYGVSGLVKEQKKMYEGTFIMGIAGGVVFCILAVVPLLIAGAMELPEQVVVSCVSALLLLVAAGVFWIVRVCMVNGSFDILLQEGEYTRTEKRVKKKLDFYSSVYWCVVTAIYLALSFRGMNWERTWIIWPVAGVLFGAVSAIVRVIADRNRLE